MASRISAATSEIRKPPFRRPDSDPPFSREDYKERVCDSDNHRNQNHSWIVPGNDPLGDHLAAVRNRDPSKTYASSEAQAHPISMSNGEINTQVQIGHVHLKVASLERAIAFYHDVLGFQVTQRFGDSAAFLSAGGYHHHIGLNTWESQGGGPPAPGTTGLYHLAILYPDRPSLGDALRRLIEAGVQLDGAADHGVSEALYLLDPDGNGVELYRDRPQEQWPRDANGELAMFTRSLDLGKLLAEAESLPPGDRLANMPVEDR